MHKILTIAWKDLRVLFSDRAALILMLAAPLLLAFGLGLVTGAFAADGGFGSVGDIPVALVNEDEGALGAAFDELFAAPELAGLFVVQTAVSPAAARAAVANDQLAAAVLIPPGFSAALLPDPATGETSPAAPLEIVSNPARPISAGVVRTVVAGVLNDIETGVLGAQVSLAQMSAAGELSAADGAALAERGRQIGEARAAAGRVDRLVRVQRADAAGGADDFNLMAYLAPGMAVLFLMFTVTQGAGSMITERDAGTLGRMLATPTSAAQILAGKISGIFLSGTAQLSILILVTSLLFGLRWGSPLLVAALILAVVAAASGWGVLLAASVDNRGQIGTLGTAMMLIFGVLGGSFFVLPQSGPVEWLSKLTPNAWAIDGFTALASGGGAAELLPILGALLLMAVCLFTAAALVFRRRPLVRL